jgi:hypothetical protein
MPRIDSPQDTRPDISARRTFKKTERPMDLLEASHQSVPHGPLDSAEHAETVPPEEVSKPNANGVEIPMPDSQSSTVEVRLLSRRLTRYVDGVAVEHKQGDVFHIDRAVYEADIEPDRGMGVPAHNRTFLAIAEEQATETTKQQAQADEAAAIQERIRATRESARVQWQAIEDARARMKAQEAEAVRAAAEAMRLNAVDGASRESR